MEKKSSQSSIGWILVLIVVIVAAALLVTHCHKKGPVGRVYFGNLTDSQEVVSPFTVEMKAESLVVEPAANGVIEGHGHFHIIIDSPLPPTGEPVPMDSTHLHYGKGQTEATLSLPVGDHTLILEFAKGNHVPYDPQIFQEIHVRVTQQTPPPSAMNMDSTGSKKKSSHEIKALPMSSSAGMESVHPRTNAQKGDSIFKHDSIQSLNSNGPGVIPGSNGGSPGSGGGGS